MPNPSIVAIIVSVITAFMLTDLARSTRLMILIKDTFSSAVGSERHVRRQKAFSFFLCLKLCAAVDVSREVGAA